ncbi:MAG: hypothetical protein HY645_04770 [Acidobacteria bacterium]|nr:hypothetical protein [Acidobacteriota bacterium]
MNDTLQRINPTVQSELYEELLDRYERVLVYAGQLQEKARQDKLLAEKNNSLEKENQRLTQLIGVERSYVRLLEQALRALGVLPETENQKSEGQ